MVNNLEKKLLMEVIIYYFYRYFFKYCKVEIIK